MCKFGFVDVIGICTKRLPLHKEAYFLVRHQSYTPKLIAIRYYDGFAALNHHTTLFPMPKLWYNTNNMPKCAEDENAAL